MFHLNMKGPRVVKNGQLERIVITGRWVVVSKECLEISIIMAVGGFIGEVLLHEMLMSYYI